MNAFTFVTHFEAWGLSWSLAGTTFAFSLAFVLTVTLAFPSASLLEALVLALLAAGLLRFRLLWGLAHACRASVRIGFRSAFDGLEFA